MGARITVGQTRREDARCQQGRDDEAQQRMWWAVGNCGDCRDERVRSGTRTRLRRGRSRRCTGPETLHAVLRLLSRPGWEGQRTGRREARSEAVRPAAARQEERREVFVFRHTVFYTGPP